ncbi:hypothetical protein BT67DRAFT_191781 [Trichocladium antarcticum]|uniref:Uncharacterized protein n=1 Tax=Trichocladium antarcticum TaxID=1450529 RepID=A0AAN6URZ7_9PEZI|nr:hypothetical protein BT67DRAFT_191781 [Trichocladium antarcticum]
MFQGGSGRFATCLNPVVHLILMNTQCYLCRHPHGPYRTCQCPTNAPGGGFWRSSFEPRQPRQPWGMRWKEKKPRQQTASGSRPGGSLGSFRKVACPLGAGPHLMAQGSDKFRGRRAPGCQVCRHIVSAPCSSAALVALPFPGSRSPGSAAIPGTPGRQGDGPGDHSRWNGGLARAIMTGTRYHMDVLRTGVVPRQASTLTVIGVSTRLSQCFPFTEQPHTCDPVLRHSRPLPRPASRRKHLQPQTP